MQNLEGMFSGTAAGFVAMAVGTAFMAYFQIMPTWLHVGVQLLAAGISLLVAAVLYEINKALDRRRWRKFWEREQKEQEARHG